MQPFRKLALGSLLLALGAASAAANADALRDQANGIFKPIPEKPSDTLNPDQVSWAGSCSSNRACPPAT